jgi:quercetin dioxygenase-like cupin family protein
MRYARLYADDAGETHFDQVALELNEADYRAPAPLMYVSHAYQANAIQFVKAPSGWTAERIHPPKPQFLLGLEGKLEIRTSDGEKRTVGPGDLVLMEDTSGKGHSSRVKGAQDWIAAIVPVERS